MKPETVLTPPKVIDIRVACPYEPIGYTVVHMYETNGSHQIDDIKVPKKCNACGRYFKLRPQITLRGVPLETK